MISHEKYRHYFPYVVLFFFANKLFLPHGLLYTTLLTPVFIYWLYKNSALSGVLKWGLLLLIPIPFQLGPWVDTGSYLISTLLIITTWIFLFTAYRVVKLLSGELDDIFNKILILNSVLIILAFIILPFEEINRAMWYFVPISPGITGFPRLMLFSYEASHYALLLSPVFIYFLLKVITGKTSHPYLISIAVFIPLALSLSFGVIGSLGLAMVIGLSIYFKKIPYTSRLRILYLILFILFILILLLFIWPDNPVYLRILNILNGTDTSAKGRLVESFKFARDLLLKYNMIFGIGPGQVKILAHDMIINYYHYTGEFAKVVRIPNSMAEMLATYGIYGFLLKLAFEIYLFFRLRIFNNLFSLTLFIFIFIYQFTGSFITNVAEVGTWALIFGSRFIIFENHQVSNNSK